MSINLFTIFRTIWLRSETKFLLAFSLLPLVVPLLTNSPDMEVFYVAGDNASFSFFVSIVFQSQFKLVLPTLIFSYMIYSTFRNEFNSGIMFLYKDLPKNRIFQAKLFSLMVLYCLYTLVTLCTSLIIFFLFLNKSNMLFSGDELLSREILSIFSTFFSNLVSILIMSYTSLKTNRAATIVISIFFVLASILSSKMGWMGYLFPNAYISLSNVSAFTSLAAMCLLSMVYMTVFYILSYKKFKKMEF